jgi:uncharacterized protein
MPPEVDPFLPRRFLRSAHAQTLASYFLPRRSRLPAPEERLFNVEEDVQVLCHCHWQADRAVRLTVVILHGLEGSTESQYVVGTANKAWEAGMNVVRMNMRNCGGTERLGPTLYHSGLSADMGAVVRALIEEDKLSRIGLAGFSMGGNLTLKLLGDWGKDKPREVVAAAAVSPAMDLAASADALHLPENRLYEWNFVHGLKRRLRAKARLFPGRYDVARLAPVRTLRDFDHHVTAHYCGFESGEDYYQRAAAARVVDRIAVPTLVIHSLDDPFIRILPETRARILANPHITYVETAHGGHCAFLAPPNGYDGRWAERRIVRFFAGQARPGQ